MNLRRLTSVPLALALLLSVVACSGEEAEEPADTGTVISDAPKTEDGADPTDAEDGSDQADSDGITASEGDLLDEALSDREILTPALEQGLAKENAEGSWNGDTLTMQLDGDVEDLIKPFQHCRIVGNFLEEGDTVILQYPNGSVDCADIPELEGQLIW